MKLSFSFILFFFYVLNMIFLYKEILKTEETISADL